MKVYIVVLVLVLGCVALFAFNIGDLGLLKSDENFYFSSARRMIRDGNFVSPWYHHHVRFEKPPLFYWAVALFFQLFGVSWSIARMTSVFFGTLTVIFTYLMSIRFFEKEKAIFAPLILATSFLFFQYARLAVIDMLFLLLVTMGMFFFLKGERDGKRWPFFLCFLSIGLSVLAKGPLGLVIAVIFIVFYAIKTKNARLILKINPIFGAIVILAVSLPWFWQMYNVHGQVYLDHLWKVEALGKSLPSAGHFQSLKGGSSFLIKHIGYYIPVVLFSFAPWSVFLPFALFKKLKTKSDKDPAFILGWFWIVFIFFTVVSFKHTHYMLLLSVPLSLILANIFSRKIFITIVSITAVVFISITGFILPPLTDPALKDFSLALASEVKKDELVGIGSGGFNLKKLGMHLNDLVSNADELGADDLAQYKFVNKEGRLLPFLESDKRVFCLIKKDAYDDKIPDGLKNKLHILEESTIWKDFDEKGTLSSVLERNFDKLKEKVYLVSNRR